MGWVDGTIIPIVKVVVYGGIILAISYIITKAFYKSWTRKYRYVFRYKIMKKKYPDYIVQWCLECAEKDMSWYDVRKKLMIKMVDNKTIWETMWVYSEILREFNIQKGGVDNGRKHQRGNSQNEGKPANFPSS